MRIRIFFIATIAVVLALAGISSAKNTGSGTGGGGTFTPAGKSTFTPAGKAAKAPVGGTYAPSSDGTSWAFGAMNGKKAVAANGVPTSATDSTAFRFGAIASNGGGGSVPNCGPGSPSGLPCPAGGVASIGMGGVRKKG